MSIHNPCRRPCPSDTEYTRPGAPCGAPLSRRVPCSVTAVINTGQSLYTYHTYTGDITLQLIPYVVCGVRIAPPPKDPGWHRTRAPSLYPRSGGPRSATTCTSWNFSCFCTSSCRIGCMDRLRKAKGKVNHKKKGRE